MVLAPPPMSFVSEVRAGVLYHEDSRLRRAFLGQNKVREDGRVDINGEILFQRPLWHFDNPIAQLILTPRPRIGASINVGNGTSHASAGFAWDFYVYKNIFFEASFGVAIHNGYTGTAQPTPNNLRALGCNPLFYQSFWLGADITERWRFMFGIEHLDNFYLCHQNKGLSNLGVRVGYRF